MLLQVGARAEARDGDGSLPVDVAATDEVRDVRGAVLAALAKDSHVCQAAVRVDDMVHDSVVVRAHVWRRDELNIA